MTSLVPFFLSRIIGVKVYDLKGILVGRVKDLLIEAEPAQGQISVRRPSVQGITLRTNGKINHYSFEYFDVSKTKGKLKVLCQKLEDLPEEKREQSISLGELVLDKQIVDIEGRKVVRVNDVRLAKINNGTFAIAVDVGAEGLLRRIGISKPVKTLFSLLHIPVPSKFILWDDMEAIDYSNLSIKLSSTYSKLNTLHPSDLADIIEDLDYRSRQSVFAALDEERAADVLEEMEPRAQVKLIEGIPVEKAADVFEKMPADEVADILDELEEERAERLLEEMEAESSQEVRELLEYEDDEVGSIMTTDYLTFHEDQTLESVYEQLRELKPDSDSLYNYFIINEKEELVGTISFRDIIVSDPGTRVHEVMNDDPIFLYDTEKMDDIAELVSKYNLLGIPVVNEEKQLEGMIVIHDIIEDLINKRRTYKK
jgi:CBS domain-containing protein/sporulation protein YlmC with PRC-barrel domain